MAKWICHECGGKMKKADSNVIICNDCGYSVDIDDYEDWKNGEYDTIYEEHCVDVPVGCAACGGPYPDCMDSCNMFD